MVEGKGSSRDVHDYVVVKVSYIQERRMADIVRKQMVAVEGATVRERLQAMDDSAVVTAFLGGEERAFSELVTRYQTRLLNFVYRTIGDREKAEDLVQEVFIRVYRHLHRFDRSKKFSTWVYTIASNLAKNELRNRSRNPLVLFQTVQKNFQDEDRPLQFEDPNSRPDDMYRKRHLRRSSRRALRNCPNTIGMCSFCGSSRANLTRRSQRSLTATSAR